MRKESVLISLPLLLGTMSLQASVKTDSVTFGALSHSGLWESRRADFFSGPATSCFRYESNLTLLEIVGSLQRGKGSYAPQLGTDPRQLGFTASTYTLHSSHALTGQAAYSISHTNGVFLNENADPLIVYPYLTSDSIGGSITSERYLFEGGFADNTDKFFWGVSGGYEAGLHYRMVDPRPKNITGKLTISGGIGMKSGGYGLALSAKYMRYTQSSDLMFKDESGAHITYQMTGLGNYYNRFTGLGQKSRYRGNAYCISAELIPCSDSGFVIEGSFNRFSFTKLLTDLNSLPLADCWENRTEARGGYLSENGQFRWIADLEVLFVRRHGIVNIFGDATLSSYPQIDALEIYSDNRTDLRLSFTMDWRFHKNQSLGMRLCGIIARRSEIYAAPRTERITSEEGLNLTLQYLGAFRHNWVMKISPWGILDNNLSGGVDLELAKKVGQRISIGLSSGFALNHERLSDFDNPGLVSGKSIGGRVGLFVAF
ncbi:MAG: hypothetical protein HDS26_00350 [Bacteroides sp.]|nr:hypothetical protein [Bacteroides sp.]